MEGSWLDDEQRQGRCNGSLTPAEESVADPAALEELERALAACNLDERGRAELAARVARYLTDLENAAAPSPPGVGACPRCLGPMPARPGATSRADDSTEVCPLCGSEEALRDALRLPRIATSA